MFSLWKICNGEYSTGHNDSVGSKSKKEEAGKTTKSANKFFNPASSTISQQQFIIGNQCVDVEWYELIGILSLHYIFFSLSPFSIQTEELVVDEPRRRHLHVPVTLIREKGTYGTVTVNFEVRRKCTAHILINLKYLVLHILKCHFLPCF